MSQDAQQWQLKHVYIKLPRCPMCKGIDLQTNGTPKQRKPEPGIVKLQSKLCRECGHTFQIHFE